MPNSSPLQYLRRSLLAVADPKFLLERETAAAAGAIDFASSINHEGGAAALYPPFDPVSLKQAILKAIRPTVPAPLGSGNILFTRGSSEGIDLCLRACLSEGSGSAVYPYPTFPMYEYWARLSGIAVQRFPLAGDQLDTLPAKAMQNCGATLAFVCNPNSPTGIPFTKEAIVSFIQGFAGLVVVDEAYIDFCSEYSLVPHLPELPNALVLRSFSKSWGLAGARLGCILGDERLITALRILQGPFGLPSPVEESLRANLADPQSRSGYLALMEQERTRITQALAHRPGVVRVFPSSTNFILFQHKLGGEAHRLLLDQGLFLNDCGSLAPGTLRLSLRSKSENDRFLAALEKLETR